MTILVTGAGGYLGAAVLARLAGRHDVVAVLRRQPARADEPCGLPKTEICDLIDQAAVARLIGTCKPDGIIHCAATVGNAGDIQFAAKALGDNVAATAFLAAEAARAGCRVFVNASTASLYAPRPPSQAPATETEAPCPTGPYATSKWLAEQALSLATTGGMRAVSLRFSGIHGAPRRSGAPARFLERALSSRPITIRNRSHVYQFVELGDAACAMVSVLEAKIPEGHTVCNIAGATAMSLEDWAKTTVEISGESSQITVEDSSAVLSMALSTERAASLIGFAPTATEIWLGRLAEYLRTHPVK